MLVIAKNPNLARRNRKVAIDPTNVEVNDDLDQTPLNEVENESSKSSLAKKLEVFSFTIETIMENQSHVSASKSDCYFFCRANFNARSHWKFALSTL